MDIFGRIIRQVVENKNTITVNLQFVSQAHLDMFKRTPSLRRLLHQSQLGGLRYPGANRLTVNHYIFSQLQDIADSTGLTLTQVQSLNEFTEKVINQLVVKFNKEGGPDETVIRAYVQRFKQIQNKLEKRDPFTYTWEEFEAVVDANPEKRIKAGKLDPTVSDANLIYNKDGIRVYAGTDKNSCVKYGNGYSWCISARGERNLYGNYRLQGRGSKATPYFIFNDNLSSEQESGKFIDANHALVLFIKNKEKPDGTYIDEFSYTVTNAHNDKDKKYLNSREIQKDFPWISNQIIDKIVHIEPSEIEVKTSEISRKYEKDVMNLTWKVSKQLRKFGNMIRDASKNNPREYIKALQEKTLLVARVEFKIFLGDKEYVRSEEEDPEVHYLWSLTGDRTEIAAKVKEIKEEYKDDFRFKYDPEYGSTGDTYEVRGEVGSFKYLDIFSKPKPIEELLKLLLTIEALKKKRTSDLSKLKLGVSR